MNSRYREESTDAHRPAGDDASGKEKYGDFFSWWITSKSMEGTKLDSLNKVMGEILPELIGVERPARM